MPFFRHLIGEISAKIPRVSTVHEISQAIEHLDVRDQMRLLHDLPAHLKIQPEDVAWLKVAEPAFEFWNNPEDAIYDELQPRRRCSCAVSVHRFERHKTAASPGSFPRPINEVRPDLVVAAITSHILTTPGDDEVL